MSSSKPRLLFVALLVSTAAAQQPEPKKTEPLHDLSVSLEALARRVNRAVVQIYSSGYSIGSDGHGAGGKTQVLQELIPQAEEGHRRAYFP